MNSNTLKLFLRLGVCLQLLAGLSGCESAVRDISPLSEPPLNLASLRSRGFDTTDREKTLRAIITALQDLDFVVDRADYTLGSVSGTKSSHYLLRLTVTVVPQGESRLIVRANARYDVTPVLDPDPYQKFFAVLSHELSLEAWHVD